MNEDIIKVATSQTKGCLVPELNRDMSVEQISVDHFKSFKVTLNMSLHLLFDLIQQNENVLFEIKKETESFQINFLLLLCEQTASNTLFQTDEIILLQNFNSLLIKHLKKLLESNSIKDKILNYYKSKLKIDLWKRNIGAIHGFSRFCQVYLLY